MTAQQQTGELQTTNEEFTVAKSFFTAESQNILVKDAKPKKNVFLTILLFPEFILNSLKIKLGLWLFPLKNTLFYKNFQSTPKNLIPIKSTLSLSFLMHQKHLTQKKKSNKPRIPKIVELNQKEIKIN